MAGRPLPFFGGPAKIWLTVRGVGVAVVCFFGDEAFTVLAGEAAVFLVDFSPPLTAGERALAVGGVVAFVALVGEEVFLTGVVALVALATLAEAEAGEAAAFFSFFAGVCAFAFAGVVFFVTLPVCTFSAAAGASWALVENVVLRGGLLVTLRSGLLDLALAFLAGVVAFFLPLASAGVPAAPAFAMVRDVCDAIDICWIKWISAQGIS